jgi:nitrate reductase delta subunit
MADLKRSMSDAAVDLGGELPDHIEPILRYLAVATEPLPDLLEVFVKAVSSMRETLERADRDNPYCELVAATVAFAADLRPLSIGDKR